MKRQKFAYTAHAGDNTKFVYIPKMEQKANFVCKELSSIEFKFSKKGEFVPTGQIVFLFEKDLSGGVLVLRTY